MRLVTRKAVSLSSSCTRERAQVDAPKIQMKLAQRRASAACKPWRLPRQHEQMVSLHF